MQLPSQLRAQPAAITADSQPTGTGNAVLCTFQHACWWENLSSYIFISSLPSFTPPPLGTGRVHFQIAYCPPNCLLTKKITKEKVMGDFPRTCFSIWIGVLTVRFKMNKDYSNWNKIWGKNGKASWDSNRKNKLGQPALHRQGCPAHLALKAPLRWRRCIAISWRGHRWAAIWSISVIWCYVIKWCKLFILPPVALSFFLSLVVCICTKWTIKTKIR